MTDDVLSITPSHIVAGIGGADRDFLSICLALFDDSTLTRHLSRLYDTSVKKINKLVDHELNESVSDVVHRKDYWHNSKYSDYQLRLFLWIYLREAFDLPEKLTNTHHGALHVADDLSAALINFIDPPPNSISKMISWSKDKKSDAMNLAAHFGLFDSENTDSEDIKDPSITLNDVVMPVLQELLENSEGRMPQPSEEQIDQATLKMQSLDEDEQAILREKLGVDELNRNAAVKMLATAGGLAAFSSSVSLAGFSAYILAAQASAFIPMVSGPGLISFVSVLSNPITMIGGSAAAIWWFSRSSSKKIRMAVASRVISMLTIQGVQSGRAGINEALHAFSATEALTEIEDNTALNYIKQRVLLNNVPPQLVPYPGDAVFLSLDKPLNQSALPPGLSPQERQNAVALSAITVGDVLYSYASIEPAVLAAADFSYLADIDSHFSFATLASAMLEMSPTSALGAAARLKGYVAEQLVATELSALGHVVSFPDAANEPGWDLLVDGVEFQVKFRESAEGIKDALSKYDYPIIANTELMDKIPEEYLDSVYFIDGLSNSMVTEITESSIAAGADMLDTNMSEMALAISVFRGIKGVYDGKLSQQQATEQILLDGSVRVGLFVTGGIVGKSAGLMLFGPAGAWVLGAGLPILAQAGTGVTVQNLKKHAKFKVYIKWAEEAHSALDQLQAALRHALHIKRVEQKKKLKLTPTTDVGSYVRWRLSDNIRYSYETLQHLNCLTDENYEAPEERLREIMLWIAGALIHPVCYKKPLLKVQAIMEKRPGFIDEIDKEGLLKASHTFTDRVVSKSKSMSNMVTSKIRGLW